MSVTFERRLNWYNPLVLIKIIVLLLWFMWVMVKWVIFGPFILLAWLSKR